MKQTLRFLFFLAAFSVSQTIQAQVFIGFRAGANVSSTSLVLDQQVLQYSELTKIEFSIPVEFQINDFFSLQTGLHNEKEGTTIVHTRIESGLHVNSNTINYLGIPAVAKLRLTLDDYAIFGLVGAYARYGLRLQQEVEGYNHSVLQLDFAENDLRRWDAGSLLGVGIEKTINKGAKIVCNFRYLLGLMDICTLADDSLYNNSYAISMGISIPLRRKPVEDVSTTALPPFNLF